ncbi:hypothetical protein PG993_003585 [Apiospora rasikravindrae]|uniref:Uncharacterized protein n=1 Tax=Apiospora rasikravindrae TaxID=990691 RepID=A0ABR1TZX6_9PEZI
MNPNVSKPSVDDIDDGLGSGGEEGDGSGIVPKPNTRTPLPRRTPPPPDPDPTLEERAAKRADAFISNGKAPQIDGWDWRPFMTAVFARDQMMPVDPNEPQINFVEDSDSDSDTDSNSGTGDGLSGPVSSQPTQILSTLDPKDRVPAKDSHRPPITNQKPPPKQPGDGSWNFVLYIPEWTDPAWDPNWERVYGSNQKKPRFQRDVLQNLRPALRAEDAPRNPTPYARRWGMPSDRTDGRSRTSPTFSRTRDFSAGIHDTIVTRVMDDAMRARCREETLKRIDQGTTAYRGDGIAPEIVEEYRKFLQIPSQEEIRNGAVGVGKPFERYIETLPPAVRELYRGLIDDVLEDEDYQRLLFYDMTSDEMYRNNIFTTSDDEKYSLSEIPLHPLIAKGKWEDTLYKGAMSEYPRLVYDFWGNREEYDVHRNPNIWAALQPALQLVTRVLQTDPMFWRSLKDLRTRRKIDPRLDPRDPDEQPTPFLPKMISLDEIPQPGDRRYQADFDLRWQQLEDLANAGFDFASHIDRLLLNTIELGIGPGYVGDGGKPSSFVYGRTGLIVAGPDSKIHINISAELIWPLLVPMYSSSEKLCASYIVATTLLHELMHATNYAIDLMCLKEYSLYDQTQSRQQSDALNAWWVVATDVECGRGEPWWRDDMRCELGWAFEREFWGDSATALTAGGTVYRLSKHIANLPLAIITERHHSTISGEGNDSLVGHYPVEDYYRPVSIDYYAKFFTDAFWQVEWPRHGFAAFKRLPPERQNLCLMLPAYFPEKAMQSMFGSETWSFFRHVIRSLRRVGLSILAEYLNQVVWEVRGYHSLRNRWLLDMNTWQYDDNRWKEIVDSLDDIADDVKNKWLAVSSPTEVLYNDWKSDKLPPYPDQQEWAQIMQNQFMDLTKDGGAYFTQIETMHRAIQEELRGMERMVYEFLTVRKSQRKFIYKPETDADPLISLVNQMTKRKDDIDDHQDKLDDLQACAVLASETDRITRWCAWLDQDSQRLNHLGNLVLEEWQFEDDQAKALREAFNSVPSALYEKRSLRLQKLAMKEYTFLDHRIRDTVDEFWRKVEVWVGSVSLPEGFSQVSQAAQQKVKELQQRLNKSGGDSQGLGLGRPTGSTVPKNPSNNIFAFKNPGTQSVVDDATRRVGTSMGISNSAAVSRVNSVRNSNSTVAFGQSGFQGAKPPRRTTGPTKATSSNAFAKYSKLQSTLTNTPPKFQGDFSSQVNVTAPPASIFGGLQLPPSQNPFASTNATMMPTAPFPFPYADRNMSTSDLAYVTQNPTPALQQLITALQVPLQEYRETEEEDDIM